MASILESAMPNLKTPSFGLRQFAAVFCPIPRRRLFCSAFLLLPAFCFSAAPVTIEMWGLVESKNYMGTFAAIREFEQRNPGIHVLVGTPGGQGDLDPQKLITAMVSHTPPDIIWFGRHNTGIWAPRKVFMCIDDLVKRDGIRLEDYYPGTIGECRWEGKTYALPWNVDCRVLYCNMKLLREHGFTRPPESWDELETMSVAMTHYNAPSARYDLLGFAPNYGNSWLYLYGWQLGAKWISDDGRNALLTDPPVVNALQWMAKMTHVGGGAQKIQAFQNSAQLEGIGDPFLSERIAMQINGSYILDYLARHRPDMDFITTPPPPPQKGGAPMSWSGGFSWVIPTDARHPQEAWEFVKWMNSEEAWILQSEEQIRFARSEAGEKALFVPLYHANRVINERLFQRYMKGMPEKFVQANKTCIELLPYCKFRPVTPACSELWDAQANAILDATFDIRTPRETLSIQQERVQAVLDRYYKPPQGLIISPLAIALAAAAIVLAAAAAAITAFVLALRRQYRGMEKKRAMDGVLYVLPWILGLAILGVGPLIFSLVMAFTRYDVINPPEWIGLGNWARIFGFHRTPDGLVANDPQIWHSLWNTFYMTVIGVPVGMVVSFAIALLLNTKVRGMRLYRTLYYVPVIVPAVAAAFIWLWMLNPETGIVNYLLAPLLHKAGLAPPAWFVDARWAKPGLIMLMTWGCGGTVLIWLAGLQTMPRHLYEAAMIDGASPWSRFRCITLPLMTPYVLFIWIMGTIGSLQIFTQAYMIGAPGDAMLFYVLYLFFRAFRYFEMGYACAMAWVLFFITVTVCLWQLRVSRKWVHYETEM